MKKQRHKALWSRWWQKEGAHHMLKHSNPPGPANFLQRCYRYAWPVFLLPSPRGSWQGPSCHPQPLSLPSMPPKCRSHTCHGQGESTNTAPYLGSQACQDLWRLGRPSSFSGAQASVIVWAPAPCLPTTLPSPEPSLPLGHPVSWLASLPQKMKILGRGPRKPTATGTPPCPSGPPPGLCRPDQPACPLVLGRSRDSHWMT